jgi:hypothetical protein
MKLAETLSSELIQEGGTPLTVTPGRAISMQEHPFGGPERKSSSDYNPNFMGVLPEDQPVQHPAPPWEMEGRASEGGMTDHSARLTPISISTSPLRPSAFNSDSCSLAATPPAPAVVMEPQDFLRAVSSSLGCIAGSLWRQGS